MVLNSGLYKINIVFGLIFSSIWNKLSGVLCEIKLLIILKWLNWIKFVIKALSFVNFFILQRWIFLLEVEIDLY